MNQVLLRQPILLEEHGFDADLDEFKLHHIRLKNIDNNRRFVEYEGSFLGDCYSIDPSDWKLYAQIKVEGMTFLPGLEFYKSLIAESFSLWKSYKKKFVTFYSMPLSKVL